jgi:hypothetical protein
MEQKNLQTFNLEVKNFKEVYDYCYLNQIIDMNSFVNKCFKQGFDIQKYGMLGGETVEPEVIEKIVEVEKIVEIPVDRIVETIKEVEVVKYVDREVIKEIPVEKIVKIYDKSEPQIIEKIVEVPIEKEVIKEIIKEVPIEGSSEKSKLLESTLFNLRKELQTKQIKINELESKVKDLEGQLSNNIKATYLNGSNLKNKL